MDATIDDIWSCQTQIEIALSAAKKAQARAEHLIGQPAGNGADLCHAVLDRVVKDLRVAYHHLEPRV